MSETFQPCILLAAVFLTGAGTAWSQARLTGTVTDSSGAVVVGAHVVARNVSTGQTTRAETNSSGVYSISFLNSGQYELSCELAGFKKFARSGIVLETVTAATVDVVLEVGAVSEVVNVSAATPLLEAESGGLGQLIENKIILDLPIQSRQGASQTAESPARPRDHYPTDGRAVTVLAPPGFLRLSGPTRPTGRYRSARAPRRYILHAPFSQERIAYDRSARTIACESKKNNGNSKNIRGGATVSPALDWLAALITHLPDKGQQLVRFYGRYSNVCQGRKKRAAGPALQSVDQQTQVEDDLFRKQCRSNWSHQEDP